MLCLPIPKPILGALTLALALPAGADPADPAVVPPVKGLEVEKLEKLAFLLTYSSDTAGAKLEADSLFSFKYEDTRQRRDASKFIQAGTKTLFFSNGPAKERFHLKKVEDLGARAKPGGVVRIATIEDRKEHKAGRLYTIKKGSRNGLIIRDWTATLRFLDPAGVEHELRVEDGETFVLPGTGPDPHLRESGGSQETHEALVPRRREALRATRSEMS